MDKYKIKGMSCAACSQRVERAVSQLPEVESCAVSLLTNSMSVEGDVNPAAVMDAVSKAGYEASPADSGYDELKENNEKKLENSQVYDEINALKNRFVFSLLFLAPLMYLSMGAMMWNWPVPAVMKENSLMVAVTEAILATFVVVINRAFFVSGIRGILHRAPNMDTLVALGAGASLVYSIVMVYQMVYAMGKGNVDHSNHLLHQLYFESAAMILTLITLGKILEAKAKGKTTDALQALIDMAPENATVLRDEEEVIIPADQVQIGDVFILRAGDRVPADGEVAEGFGAFDEAALTGESIPVDKKRGDRVSAATINLSGTLRCRAVGVGENTAFANIVELVRDAAATKAPISRIADRVSGVFVPTVIAVALITLAVWLAVGAGWSFALGRAISVLVISCPCALGLATPVAIMVGSGLGAKEGILFKTAEALEKAGRVEVVAFDKTGTVTEGKPRVTNVIPADDITEERLISLGASLEENSRHPLALAVVDEGRRRGLEWTVSSEVETFSGLGIVGKISGDKVLAGNREFMEKNIGNLGDNRLFATCQGFAEEGKTSIYFATDGRLLGAMVLADQVRRDSGVSIAELHKMGLKVDLLTGDNCATANRIGQILEVDSVFGELLPGDKKNKIEEETDRGVGVAMVGDGINDGPALAGAYLGIAMGAGTDVAIDAAEVVLTGNSPVDVVNTMKIGRATLRNIRENLFWTFFYNVIGIPVAAGVLYPALGITLSPMIAAAAMSLSSFCVVSNALRLNFIKLFRERGNTTMKRTLKIEGMMCGHCEATVKKALESLDFVENAMVSYEKGKAEVFMEDSGDDALLKKAVEDRDYKVVEIV